MSSSGPLVTWSPMVRPLSLPRSSSIPETFYNFLKCCITHYYRWHSLIRTLRMYIVISLWELVINSTWYLFPSLIPWILKDLPNHMVQALNLDLLQVSFPPWVSLTLSWHLLSASEQYLLVCNMLLPEPKDKYRALCFLLCAGRDKMQ